MHAAGGGSGACVGCRGRVGSGGWAVARSLAAVADTCFQARGRRGDVAPRVAADVRTGTSTPGVSSTPDVTVWLAYDGIRRGTGTCMCQGVVPQRPHLR